MLAAVAAALLGAAPCTIEGTITLTKDGQPYTGKRVPVVVYVESSKPVLPPPEPKSPSQVLQQNKQFEPQVLVLGINNLVTFENLDKTEHSVFSASPKTAFEFAASSKGRTGEKSFLNAGSVLVQCDRHKQMRADILVVKNDAWAMVESDGRYKLDGLPAGKYTLKVWEPNGGTIAPIKISKCEGPTTVTLRELELKPPPELTHKDGRAYLEYEN